MLNKFKTWLKSIFVKEVIKEVIIEKYYVNEALADLIHSLPNDFVVDFDGIKIKQPELLGMVTDNGEMKYKVDDSKHGVMKITKSGSIQYHYPKQASLIERINNQ